MDREQRAELVRAFMDELRLLCRKHDVAVVANRTAGVADIFGGDATPPEKIGEFRYVSPRSHAYSYNTEEPRT